MMDFPLTLPHLLRRSETYFGDKEIVTRLPDRSFHRYTYSDMARRAKQLAVALRELGLERGDRVATLSWNHYQHLEAYFGIPCGGFVLHTLNLRLHPNDNGYIAAHAGVSMFPSNAWGYPYIAAMLGSKQVFPGPHLDPESLLDDVVQEGVTWTAGVPTIWLGILQLLDAHPGKWDLSRMKGMLVGGSAAPRAMIAGFKERHNLMVCHGWGMTETSPVASVAALPGEIASADEETKFDYLAMQGLPLALVELRARDDSGNEIPRDGETMGELEVRGPWVASAYYETPEQSDRWTDDGWFKTGDIVSFDPRGHIQIKDRSKDVIKSGGEWISSVDLENALMAHPAVAEAAVIAIPDEKWQERPLAAVLLRDGASATAEELRDFLAPQFAKWWLPDRIEFVSEIPKTAVGKFRKTALREQFAQEPAATTT